MLSLICSLGLRLGRSLDLDFPCVSNIPLEKLKGYSGGGTMEDIAPIPNYTLLTMVVLTRHGARSPIDTYYPNDTGKWYCDDDDELHSWAPRYSTEGGKNHRRHHLKLDPERAPFKPSCPAGGLIVDGMRQHHDLGNFFRRQYIENVPFLPKKYDPQYIFIRSSEVDRCIRSAMSFLSGLYPSASPDEVITIQTGTSALEMLHPSTSQCADLNKAWDNWINSDEYQTRKNLSTPFLKPLADDAGVPWDERTWMFIGDWMATVACTGHEFPPGVNDTVLEVGMRAVEFYSHGFFGSARGVAGAAIVREILRVIDERVAGKRDTKFALLSAHDVSIVAALTLLGYNNPHWSPFRSYFVTELWQAPDSQLYLRFLYNSEPVPIDFMDGETVVKLSKFRMRVAKYLDYCHEFQ